jgi:hypothetical protein
MSEAFNVGLSANTVTIQGAECSAASGLSYQGPIQGKVKLRFGQGEIVLPAEHFPFLESGDMVLVTVSVVKVQLTAAAPPPSPLILNGH